MKIKFAIVTAVVGAILFASGIYFQKIMTPPTEIPADEEEVIEEEVETVEQDVLFVHVEKLVTNYSQGGRSKTAMISLKIPTRSTETFDAIEKIKPMVVDALIVMLKDKSANYFESQKGLEQMKIDFEQTTKDVLANNSFDATKVEGVLITNLVTQ